MISTLTDPTIIVKDETGKKTYVKLFKSKNGSKNQVAVIYNDKNGDFVYTSMPVDKDKKYLLNRINNSTIIYKKGQTRVAKSNPAANDSIADINTNFKPKENLVEKFILKPRIDKIILGESKWGKFYTDWVDRLTPIENLVKKAKERTSIPFAKNTYLRARMYAGFVESYKPVGWGFTPTAFFNP